MIIEYRVITMVSSGQISSDLSTMTNTLNQYDSAIDGLSGVWKGDSYNNLVSKANEFLSAHGVQPIDWQIENL